ncbi:MAG TPA: hypothetical protein VJH03_11425 [Blastocatellia bacterium]|nr:hypothetical protein [Blastocatellia bacterium]
MKVYRWDSFERRFNPGPFQDYLPPGEKVLMMTVAIGKGETVGGTAASGERMFCLLRGSWHMSVAESDLVVRRNEAVIIPSGFPHTAMAIEDSFALQMERESGEEENLWAV